MLPKLNAQQMAFIDLFCGIGGMRLGLERVCKEMGIDCSCVGSYDFKPYAAKIYQDNFGDVVDTRDVCTIPSEEIPECDVLLAGFPCQSFSQAGKRDGFKDVKRGNLFFQVMRFVDRSRPRLILLENVEGIVKHDKGRTIATIRREIIDRGYSFRYTLVNAADVGVPQSRTRIFIVAQRGEQHLTDAPIPLSGTTGSEVRLKDILDTTDTHSNVPRWFLDSIERLMEEKGDDEFDLQGMSFKDKRGGPQNIHSWDLGMYGKVSQLDKVILDRLLLERRKKKWATLKNMAWMDGIPLTLADISSFCPDIGMELLEERLEKLVAQKYIKKDIPKDIVDGKRQRMDPSLVGYNVNKGKLSFPITKVLHPDEFAPTLTATDSMRLGVFLPDSRTLRHLNLGELKAICGFPRDFKVEGVTKEQQFDLFGNMVCPPMVTIVLKSVF